MPLVKPEVGLATRVCRQWSVVIELFWFGYHQLSRVSFADLITSVVLHILAEKGSITKKSLLHTRYTLRILQKSESPLVFLVDTNIPMVYLVPCLYAVLVNKRSLRLLHFFLITRLTAESTLARKSFILLLLPLLV